ncbi:NAD(P)/FAD-dependent oxidoreductase [Rhodococcus sp. BS-15]|uniref:dihydrolipoyl dehydrogenase family protein n=1 Tax=Rhodococcus sp. BS-15 TaxID=1304954 RepID=UPI000AC56B31|nr:NAD(P)/FAD-dependent oxidoreductase [Rhodococcus sp. BS-15]
MDTISSDEYDVVIIGAGPGGEDCTTALLDAGMSVALVEAEIVGGECFNWACVPSKAMLRPGHALRSASRSPGAREAITRPLDASAALSHRQHVVLHHDDSSVVESFTSAGAVFIRGRGCIEDRNRVVVTTSDGERRLRARHAVILATGSTAALPDIPGLADAEPWTNREATSATESPTKLIVLGSGAVGLELAQAWRSLGTSEVIVLSRSGALLPDHEPFVGELVLEGLHQAGVEVRFNTQVSGVDRLADGGVNLMMSDGTIERADELLVAVGKNPATVDLGIDTVGLTPGAFVDVGNDMRVAETDWLYAIGDVNGRALLSHQASYHGRIAASSVVQRARGEGADLPDEVNETAVPQVLFTDPEVASVGLTLQQAESRGIRARKIETDLGAVLGAQLHAKDYRGE